MQTIIGWLSGADGARFHLFRKTFAGGTVLCKGVVKSWLIDDGMEVDRNLSSGAVSCTH